MAAVVRLPAVTWAKIASSPLAPANKMPNPHHTPWIPAFAGMTTTTLPVIPGEQRETRNPGAPRFCFYAERPALWAK
jgi:hypothetical protein